MSKQPAGPPESDRFDDAPHPRETLALFGHAAAERELLDAYRRNRLAQAWILGGPEGIGKATLAWRFARFLLAHPDAAAPDVQAAETLAVPEDHPAARRVATLALADIFLLRREWNDKAKPPKHFTEIRVDDVREITRAFHQGSGTGGWRVAIIDSADDLNRNAANALLKLIEEPPERSLFLLVAHQPGRILPTIRSRCRKLMLSPLTLAETIAAVESLGAPWSGEADIAAAAARAEGSVRETLRLLGGDAMAFDSNVSRLLQSLPRVDWLGVHMLADKLTGRDNEVSYETFMRALERHLDARVRTLSQGGAPPARLVGYARAWDDIRELARETEVFNFDKKAMVLGVFDRLAKAEGG